MDDSGRTLDLCRELMRRQSVTPEDAGCQDLIRERLEAIGFQCRTLRFGEVTNLWAVRGSAGPLFAFAGHTDVVPPGPEANWHSPPFEPALDGDLLRGRGAADMKASLAAMVTACETFVARHPDHPGRIALLLTSDEEGPAVDGTVRVMEQLTGEGEHIDWCLVGEPSSSATLGDVIKNGRRGSLGARITVRGRQGHVAYPHLARNPVHMALPALQALAAERWDDGNAFFPPTTFQISNIGAGTGATNVIPGELTVLCNFRFSTEVTEQQLRRRTREILDRHDLDYDIDWTLSGQPFLTARGALVDAVQAAVRGILGVEAELSTAGGTSDGRFIAPYGTQVVELGPVNATIHQVDEAVAVADLPRLSAVYTAVLERLLAS